MIIGINALNLRMGGGVTHIVSFLASANPSRDKFEKIVIWGSFQVLSKIEDKAWLVKICPPDAERGLLQRVLWQAYRLKSELNKHGCNILFSPGGTDFCRFNPVVRVSQNMLPFEYREIARYWFSLSLLKFLVLRYLQAWHFARADGVIFLTEYARNKISKIVFPRGEVRVIPHGVDKIFSKNYGLLNIVDKKISTVNLKLLYISNIELYKHQWNVVEAVALLKSEGFSITLDLIGAPMRGMSRLKWACRKFDPTGSFIKFHGELPHAYLSSALDEADIFIFASSCENLPIILLEAMASGKPIACSAMGPMPDVLGGAGVYFHPLSVESIAHAIRILCDSQKLRETLSIKAIAKASNYTWDVCSKNTLQFLHEVSSRHKHQFDLT